VNKIGPAFPGAKLPAVMISRMWPMPAPIRKHASARLVASRASKERNAAYKPAQPIPRLAAPTSNWKGLVCHPIACAALAGKTMWPSAAQNPINPTGKMKAYRSKRSSTKARATGRGPLAIAIAAPASAATHDSTGTIETTRFLRGPGKLAAHCDAALGGARAWNLDEVSEHPGSAIMFAELMRVGEEHDRGLAVCNLAQW
jgi:hypothetical protein